MEASMRARIIVMLFVVLPTVSLVASGQPHHAQSMTATCVESVDYSRLDEVTWESGYPPTPGGKVRGLTLPYMVTEIHGSALDFLADAKVLYTINCNLDENLTGPCWGTVAYSKDSVKLLEGVWSGEYNFSPDVDAGRWQTVANGTSADLRGLVLHSDAVTPGPGPEFTFDTYIYARVTSPPGR
jgi:hypothetical protein